MAILTMKEIKECLLCQPEGDETMKEPEAQIVHVHIDAAAFVEALNRAFETSKAKKLVEIDSCLLCPHGLQTCTPNSDESEVVCMHGGEQRDVGEMDGFGPGFIPDWCPLKDAE